MRDKDDRNTTRVKEKIICYHCGDECRDEHVVFEGKDFCCMGCKTVYEILDENDLCTYYDLDKNPGISLKSKSFGDKYDFLENEDVAALVLDYRDEEKAVVNFYIPSIHCSSCIWLLENLYRMKPGISHSRVNFAKKEMHLVFDPRVISLKQLVELLTTLGYEPLISLEDHEKEKKEKINRSIYLKIGIAGFAFGNIMMLSFPEYFGFEGIQNTLLSRFISWLNVLLSLPVVFYCSSDYFKSALAGFRQKYINIDVPISLGIIVLFLRSLYEIFITGGPGYLDSLSGLVFFLLVGKWFQNFTYQGLTFDRDYKSYFPLAVHRLTGGEWLSVPVKDLGKDDLILVRNREIIPVDSILESPFANIDYSFVTGESDPQVRKEGEYIYAGGRQVGEGIKLRVKKSVSQSYLMQLWNNEAFSKEEELGFTHLVNVISKYFTLGVISFAIAGLIYWSGTSWGLALNVFTAVLIVACPCALALSTPFTLGSAMRIFGKRRFYLKNVNVLEKMLYVTHIVFDKTGTITQNEESRMDFRGRKLEHSDFQKIKALVVNSTHPLSRKIAAGIDMETNKLVVESFEEVTGQGLKALIAGEEIRLGNKLYVLEEKEIESTGDTSTRIYLSKGGEYMGYFALKNRYRDGIKTMVNKLAEKYKLSVLTGDNEKERANLEKLFPENTNFLFHQSPKDKLEYIRTLQNKGECVLMIGDGLNDAGALKQSNLGFTITDDITHFTPASDGIMDARSLVDLPGFLDFAYTARHIIIAAFVISFLYNGIGLGFALAAMLTPLFAAILMPLSSISVVVFATTVTNYMAKFKKLI